MRRPAPRCSAQAVVGWFGSTLTLAGLLLGCTGRGHVDVAALNFQAIDPPAGPPPRFLRVDFDRCYWWTDDANHIWVAMEREQSSWLGPLGQFRFRMSLALGEPPAGRARDYLVTRRELRAVARLGPTQSRFVSNAGIVALYRAPGDRMRGSFRLEVSREVQQMLGNWSGPTRYLMMGTFEAVADEARGRPIATETETRGQEREGWSGRLARPLAAKMATPPMR